ncbi:hypothetical protein PMAYCL1PPCAC_10277, partial [Pristionchus mayeri]
RIGRFSLYFEGGDVFNITLSFAKIENSSTSKLFMLSAVHRAELTVLNYRKEEMTVQLSTDEISRLQNQISI